MIGQLHQLAHVSHLPADTKSCTKINFFCENNTTKCTTFSQWLTGWHLTVCDASTCSVNTSYCAIEEDSAQIPSRDVVVFGKMIHSLGEQIQQKNFPELKRKKTTHLKEDWPSKKRGDLRHHLWLAWNSAQRTLLTWWAQVWTFCGARGTELLQC